MRRNKYNKKFITYICRHFSKFCWNANIARVIYSFPSDRKLTYSITKYGIRVQNRYLVFIASLL